jgi:GT2 family glycosyltransferase
LPAAAGKLSILPSVVDNGSSDETVATVRARGGVSIIETGENLGYAGAINLGRAHAAPCTSLLILNPDLILEPAAIEELYGALADPKVGAAVPMLLNEDGSLYLTLRREPSPLRAVGDALFGARFADRPGWLSETVRDFRAYAHPRDTTWAGGAAMLVSSVCHGRVGDWDDRRFFLYSEETDFACRVRRAGFVVRYVPAARAWHEDGGSGRSPALAGLLAVNRLRYYEKYHGRVAAAIFRAAVMFQHLLRCHRADERAALRAICDRSRWPALPGGRA